MTGLPVVPVHDLKVHPREHELIAATHGRGIWIVDVAPLEQLADSVLSASAHLFEPKTAYESGEAVRANASGGHKQFISPSPQYGAEIVYRLTSGDRRTQTKIAIRDVRGDTVRTVNGPGGPGLHRATWGFQGRTPPPQTLSPSQRRDSTLIVRRIQPVVDLLEKAGAQAQMLGALKKAPPARDLQGPGEGFAVGGGGGGRGGGGGGGGGGPGGSGGAAAVSGGASLWRTPGDGKPPPGVLRVGRARGRGGGASFASDDDEDAAP